jgi:glycosyltransferase involved in cell wall biosynthesis
MAVGPAPRAPAVSVLLPVRDGMSYLPAALRSLRRQTERRLEIVAVDDGSTDGSSEELDRWAVGDPRLRVLHRPAEGLVAALNAGLAACRAPVVARMDADDACHPRRLELQLAALEREPELGVASCLVRCVPRSRIAGGFREYERWLNGLVRPAEIARERFVDAPVAHPTVAVRRDLLVRHGGWRDRGWAEDHDLWLRLLEAGVRFRKVPEVLYFWRDHGERLTRTDGRYAKRRFLELKARFLTRGPLAKAATTVVWGAGPTGRGLARALAGEGVAVAAFVDIDPAKIGREVRGAPVVGPEGLGELLGPGTVVLAAVASRGARELVRERLVDLGLEEGAGFWCVA